MTMADREPQAQNPPPAPPQPERSHQWTPPPPDPELIGEIRKGYESPDLKK